MRQWRRWRRIQRSRCWRSAAPSARVPSTEASSAPASPSLLLYALLVGFLQLFYPFSPLLLIRSRSDLPCIHTRDEDRVRRHHAAPLRQHRPRGQRQLPGAGRGFPPQNPWGGCLPLCLARVQLLHDR